MQHSSHPDSYPYSLPPLWLLAGARGGGWEVISAELTAFEQLFSEVFFFVVQRNPVTVRVLSHPRCHFLDFWVTMLFFYNRRRVLEWAEIRKEGRCESVLRERENSSCTDQWCYGNMCWYFNCPPEPNWSQAIHGHECKPCSSLSPDSIVSLSQLILETCLVTPVSECPLLPLNRVAGLDLSFLCPCACVFLLVCIVPVFCSSSDA